MGIAYADLPSLEEAEKVMSDLDKSVFKDRKLRIRFHVPFTPGPRFPRLGSIKHHAKKDTLAEETSPPSDDEEDEVTSAGNTPRPVDQESPSSNIQFSESVLFVKGMRHKVREEKIMLYFKEFNPMEVIIQKPRGIMKGLKSRAYHSLVLFDLPFGVKLDKVISECKGRLFDGYHLTLMRAFALREKLFSLQVPVEPRLQDGETALSLQALGPSTPVTPIATIENTYHRVTRPKGSDEKVQLEAPQHKDENLQSANSVEAVYAELKLNENDSHESSARMENNAGAKKFSDEVVDLPVAAVASDDTSNVIIEDGTHVERTKTPGVNSFKKTESDDQTTNSKGESHDRAEVAVGSTKSKGESHDRVEVAVGSVCNDSNKIIVHAEAVVEPI